MNERNSLQLIDSFPRDGQRIVREQVKDFYLKFNNPIDRETEPYIVNYNVQKPGFAQWNVTGWIQYAENDTKLIWHPRNPSDDTWYSPSEVDYQRLEIHLGRRGIDKWMVKDIYGNRLPFTVIRVFIPENEPADSLPDNFKHLSILLAETFSDEQLRSLCYDTGEFKSVYDQFSPNDDKARIINQLINYAQRTSQTSILEALYEKLKAEDV